MLLSVPKSYCPHIYTALGGIFFLGDQAISEKKNTGGFLDTRNSLWDKLGTAGQHKMALFSGSFCTKTPPVAGAAMISSFSLRGQTKRQKLHNKCKHVQKCADMCINASMQTCANMCKHVHTHASMQTCACMCIHIHKCNHVQTNANMCIHMHPCKHVHTCEPTYINASMCKHVHTHAYVKHL